ncbi:MAG: sigma 54-interacting transcriptional regulator [Planctomycetota bacterium]
MIIRILSALGPSSPASSVRTALEGRSVVLVELGRGESPWDRLRRDNFDLFLVEDSLLRRRNAPSIAEIRALPDHPEVIVFAEENPESRARFLTAGVMAVIHRGLAEAALGETLRALLERRREDASRRLHAERSLATSRLTDFCSASPAMAELMEVVRRVVDADSSLLLLGETGVGKERLARAIHAESRAAGPFIAVNCAALPETLIESELFGHVEGAFTGASRARRGFFELAHGGTLFLDEIADLPLHLQAKLLRALQEKAIHPVGAEKGVAVDVRVMAATNRDLAAALAAGRFRSDLYWRLAVVTLTIPPLRERREDIPDLVGSHVAYFREHLNRPVTGVSPEALDLLQRYPWPGNVRELANVIERAVLLAANGTITPADLPLGLEGPAPGAASPAAADGEAPARSRPADLLDRPWHLFEEGIREAHERLYFRSLLARSGGRIGEAARRAGISPRALYTRMRRLGLKKEDFKYAAGATGGGK